MGSGCEMGKCGEEKTRKRKRKERKGGEEKRQTDLVERLGRGRVREREVERVGVDVLPEVEREAVGVLVAFQCADLCVNA